MSDAIQTDARPTAALPVWFQQRWLKLALTVLEPLSVAGLMVFMLAKSWLRWSDPLIDFPRDLYIAWRLSEGDLLYQKISNWYGPLANLIEGAGFRIFGVGMDTMVWMNIALTVVVLLLLRGIFGLIGNRFMVWLSSIIFVLVIMVGHYTPMAGYNFITPYVAQSTYSFLGLLLVLWGLLKHLKSGRPIWLGVAGLGFAVAYLDKPEAVLAALGASGIYFLAQTVRAARQGGPMAGWRSLRKFLGWFGGGFMGLWLVVFAYFCLKGGFAYAMRATNFVVVFLLDDSVRHAVATLPFFQRLIGFDAPLNNFLLQLKMGGGLVFASAILIAAGWAWARARLFGMAWWIWLLVMAGVTLAAPRLFVSMHEDFARSFVFPVCLTAAGYSTVSLWMAWRSNTEFSRILGLALVGVAASLMLVRMLLNARFIYYGFYMMPLALLFWFQLMVVEAPRSMAGQGLVRWPMAAVFSAVLLSLAAFLGKNNVEVYARKTYPVGEGRDRFYTVRPEAFLVGLEVNFMVGCFHKFTPNAKTLVAFPEGIAVNYLLRVPTPLSELEFRPVALSYVGAQHVIEELKANPPDAVFLFAADLSESDVPYFGADEASGRGIVLWLNENYSRELYFGQSPLSITGDGIDMLVPKIVGDKRPPLLPVAK